MTIEVEHVDFWAVPVTDMERSKQFYGETLGLPLVSEPGFPEYKLGDNGFLYLLSLEAIGGKFRAPHDAGFALRVPDVAEARAALEAKGVEFNGEILDTGVCHMTFFADPDGNQIVLHRNYTR
ncbi:MAG: VOC family protein [Actinobacteria bacterium]|nr:VOC family protein [Actinomycetota bacterium]